MIAVGERMLCITAVPEYTFIKGEIYEITTVTEIGVRFLGMWADADGSLKRGYRTLVDGLHPPDFIETCLVNVTTLTKKELFTLKMTGRLPNDRG